MTKTSIAVCSRDRLLVAGRRLAFTLGTILSSVALPGELWLDYFSIGGNIGEYEVEAYLQGLLSLPSSNGTCWPQPPTNSSNPLPGPAPYSEKLATAAESRPRPSWPGTPKRGAAPDSPGKPKPGRTGPNQRPGKIPSTRVNEVAAPIRARTGLKSRVMQTCAGGTCSNIAASAPALEAV